MRGGRLAPRHPSRLLDERSGGVLGGVRPVEGLVARWFGRGETCQALVARCAEGGWAVEGSVGRWIGRGEGS